MNEYFSSIVGISMSIVGSGIPMSFPDFSRTA